MNAAPNDHDGHELHALKGEVHAITGELRDMAAVVHKHSEVLATHTVLLQQHSELLAEHSVLLKHLIQQVANVQTEVAVLNATAVTNEKALALRNGVVQWIATTFVIGQIIPFLAHHFGVY